MPRNSARVEPGLSMWDRRDATCVLGEKEGGGLWTSLSRALVIRKVDIVLEELSDAKVGAWLLTASRSI